MCRFVCLKQNSFGNQNLSLKDNRDEILAFSLYAPYYDKSFTAKYGLYWNGIVHYVFKLFLRVKLHTPLPCIEILPWLLYSCVYLSATYVLLYKAIKRNCFSI